MQSLGFLVIFLVCMLLIRAYKNRKQKVQQVQEANFDNYRFEYELETESCKVSSTKREAVFDVRGKKAKLVTPYHPYACWLSLFDDEGCVNFFFYDKIKEIEADEDPTESVELLLNFLDQQNLILR